MHYKMITTMSSYHLSPYKVNTILTVFHILYITSPWLIHFITRSLCLLIPATHFPPCPRPLFLWQPPLGICSLYLWVWVQFCFVCLFCILNSTYKWNHVVFVFLWLILLSIIPSRSNHVVANDNISFFLMTE